MENPSIPKVALALSLLGALPFVGLSVGISLEIANKDLLLQPLFTYGAVVLSFLGGIHWGLGVSNAQTRPHVAYFLYLLSVSMALLAWGVLFIAEPYLRLLAYAFLYAVVWGIDSLLYGRKLIPLWYFNLRGIVTPIVVVSMYVAYFSVI